MQEVNSKGHTHSHQIVQANGVASANHGCTVPADLSINLTGHAHEALPTHTFL